MTNIKVFKRSIAIASVLAAMLCSSAQAQGFWPGPDDKPPCQDGRCRTVGGSR